MPNAIRITADLISGGKPKNILDVASTVMKVADYLGTIHNSANVKRLGIQQDHTAVTILNPKPVVKPKPSNKPPIQPTIEARN